MHEVNGKRSRISLALATGALLLQVIASASAQTVQYGVRVESGESWAYLETATGEELIAAPYSVLTDAFRNVGGELAGTGAVAPHLVGLGTLGAGSSNSLTLTDGLPHAPLQILVGLSAVYGPLKGGTLVPSPDFMISGLTTDASGSRVLPFEWSGTLPPGTGFFVQCWLVDAGGPAGFSASNGLQCDADLVGQTLEDESRIRLLGLDPDEVEALEDQPNTQEIALLQGPDALESASLWSQGFPAFSGTNGELVVLTHLSVHMAFMVQKAQPWMPDATFTADGCTNAPDFNFTHCCNAHDDCYDIGGDSDDRKTCDVALRVCIKGRGHPILAWIYYWAVRAFGASHFNDTTLHPEDP
jgi:hypothetical protein